MRLIPEIPLIYDYETASWWAQPILMPYKFDTYYLFRYYNARFKKVSKVVSAVRTKVSAVSRSITRNNYTSIQCKLLNK